MHERDWQAIVVDAAKLNGWRVYHTFDSRRSEPGFPDLVMVRGGRLIAAELKSETGRPTRAQVDWLRDLEAVESVETYLWRPSDWEQVCEKLGRN